MYFSAVKYFQIHEKSEIVGKKKKEKKKKNPTQLLL